MLPLGKLLGADIVLTGLLLAVTVALLRPKIIRKARYP